MKRTLLCFLTCAFISFAQAQDSPVTQQVPSELIQKENTLTVFPNPVESKLNLKATSKIESYKIYNVLGKLVVEGRSLQNHVQLDVSDLQRGVYMLEVYSNSEQFTRKLIKE